MTAHPPVWFVTLCKRCKHTFNVNARQNPYQYCPLCRAEKWEKLLKLSIKRKKTNETH
jgi:hypothetical protein